MGPTPPFPPKKTNFRVESTSVPPLPAVVTSFGSLTLEVVLLALPFEQRVPVPHPALPGLELLAEVGEEFGGVVRHREGMPKASGKHASMNASSASSASFSILPKAGCSIVPWYSPWSHSSTA
jgi:hypothetical protein